jgi:rare lipoprotein A
MSLFSSSLSLANIKRLIFLIFAFQLALWVAIPPLRAEDSTPAKEITSETEQVKTSSIEEEEPAGTLGIARYYAKRFNGRRTGSGAIYNPRKLTAAHPTLPFGTRVKVDNIANGKSVIVTVNDRCREHEEIFIDLSREAARQIGMIRQRKANVRLLIIEEDNETR